jgi:hypothetical protein
MRSLVLWVLGLAALVLNPMACIGPSFDFGATEMRAAIEGTWKVTVGKSDVSAMRELTITLEQSKEATQVHAMRSAVPVAAACGSRSLVKNAEACMDVTHMPLAVAVLAGAGAKIVSHGELVVPGTSFVSGQLEVMIDGELLAATITPTGIASRVTLAGLPSQMVRRSD